MCQSQLFPAPHSMKFPHSIWPYLCGTDKTIRAEIKSVAQQEVKWLLFEADYYPLFGSTLDLGQVMLTKNKFNKCCKIASAWQSSAANLCCSLRCVFVCVVLNWRMMAKKISVVFTNMNRQILTSTKASLYSVSVQLTKMHWNYQEVTLHLAKDSYPVDKVSLI